MTLRKVEIEVRRMRRWKKNAGPGHRQSAAHALKQAVTKALIAAATSRKGR